MTTKNQKTLAEYIWTDVNGGIRSKNRVIQAYIGLNRLGKFPNWNYDGSSTGQAKTGDSEIVLVPQAMYKDPFFVSDDVSTLSNPVVSYLVLCDTWVMDKDTGKLVPHPSNTRYPAKLLFDKFLDLEPWYGIEQEFFLMNLDTNRPLGFPFGPSNFPPAQGQYYCSTGGNCAYGRSQVVDAYHKCLSTGLTVSGMNAEVAPGQWEIQIGPCLGISAGDEVTVMKYILNRVTESHHCYVDYSAKPVPGDEWNGSGAHCNFSTKKMREPEGIVDIQWAAQALSEKHAEHIAVYGDDNHFRLTGKCETSSLTEFSVGVGSRCASVRIPVDVATNRCGYLEDRRPSSSADPYVVSSILLKTTSEYVRPDSDLFKK